MAAVPKWFGGTRKTKADASGQKVLHNQKGTSGYLVGGKQVVTISARSKFFHVGIDYNPSQGIKMARDPRSKPARWVTSLQVFGSTSDHFTVADNHTADVLSTSEETDLKAKILTKVSKPQPEKDLQGLVGQRRRHRRLTKVMRTLAYGEKSPKNDERSQ
ncbi:hypothetical protein FGIG_00685 [Fasciola gigantica]|uniref:Uncharacterized protein n=1 Tax=Fasciola gigantica TaxID=46835 RepID=A0A504YDT9_FASGI|nr:hypothetical protein FGIG_00685 [Fasciola gigantica]